MAHLHLYQQQTTVDVPLEYQCGACGLEMDVQVRGRGAARGLTRGEGLQARAQTWAMKSVFMRCALWPCPRCGKRDYGLWRREWIRQAFLGLLALPVTAVILWLKSSRAFGRDVGTTVWTLGALGIFIEVLIAGSMLYELRASKTAVRPLPNRGSDAT